MKRKSLLQGAARLLFVVFTCIVALGVLLCGVIYWGLGHHAGDQKRREVARELLCRAYGAEPVSFCSRDGVPLQGLLVRRPNAKGTVIFCHGFMRSKEQMARFIGLFPDHTLFLFDFRAFGQSGGAFSSIGYFESRDVLGAIDAVTARIQSTALRPLVLFGVSMGAAAALKAAAEDASSIDALIVDSPYACLTDIMHEASHHFLPTPQWLPPMLAGGIQMIVGPIFSMKPYEYVRRIQKPIFFIHSGSDQTTHPQHSMRLFCLAKALKKEPVWLWITPASRHGASYLAHSAQYKMRVARFMALVAARYKRDVTRDVPDQVIGVGCL